MKILLAGAVAFFAETQRFGFLYVSFNTSYCASIFVPSWVNSGDDSLFLW
jgi:hypothetical protein